MKTLNNAGNKSGFTLVEVLVTVVILVIGILSSLMYFTTASASTVLARDIMIATTHAEHVLEEMRSMSALADITNADWTTWASDNGLSDLSSETITVTYADNTADPLNITANVSWQTMNRTHFINLTTELTK